MGDLPHFERNFRRVGWFIPPYKQLGTLSQIAAEIEAAGDQFTQDDLQGALARLYEPYGLASMVLHRYPLVPIIRDYKITIAEAIEAHFLGLNHIAVGGLAPVIEGAGRRLLVQRGLVAKPIREVFAVLAADCKAESATQNRGAPGEIASMMDSFSAFANETFFADSRQYPFSDGTNRHGIAHGDYSDSDYGRPINFYKTIAAVDFLTFIVSFRASISWFPPSLGQRSMQLAGYYHELQGLRTTKPDLSETM
jgi:hypothetical protein